MSKPSSRASNDASTTNIDELDECRQNSQMVACASAGEGSSAGKKTNRTSPASTECSLIPSHPRKDLTPMFRLNSSRGRKPCRPGQPTCNVFQRNLRVYSVGRWFSFALVAVMAAGGCGSDRPLESSGTDVVDPVRVARTDDAPKTNSVTPASTEVESSPASVSLLPDRNAGPGEVCETFLKLLKAGDRLAAEQLLTRTALSVTSKADLQLEPPGSENAVYDVGSIRYATTLNKIAQVDCLVKETTDGTPETTTVTWLVRLQTEGWRISGIVLAGDDNIQDLLSFENADDVNRINQALIGDETAAAERQADAGSTTALK